MLLGSVLLALAGCAGPGWQGPRGRDLLLARSPLEAFVTTRIDSLGREIPEVQVRIPYRSLVFHREQDRFRAGVTATAVALRDEERVGGGVATASAAAESYQDTRDRKELLCRVPLLVEGDGPVGIQLTVQGRGTSRTWRRELSYHPQAARTIPLYFSDLSWNLEEEEGRGILGVSTDSLVVEVTLGLRPRHEDWPSGGVSLAAAVTTGDDTRIGERRLPLAPGEVQEGGGTYRLAWAARDLPFGPAALVIELVGVEGGNAERLSLDPPRRFANLLVPWWDDREWKRHVTWLEGLVDGDARARLRDLPASARLRAWNELWDALATGQEASARALERRHLERIVEADLRFGGMGRGALTDRGRTYIRYGPPDRVEAYGDDMSREGRWEIWYYIGPRIRFTFYDPHGLGDYYLYDTGLI